MQLGAAEIGSLEAGSGEIGLLPKGGAGPQAGEIGAPEQGLLEATTLHNGIGEAGVAEAGLLEATLPEVATAQIQITTIEISQAEAHKPALAGSKGGLQFDEGLRRARRRGRSLGAIAGNRLSHHHAPRG